MKKYLFIVLLVGVCFGQDGLFSIFKSKYQTLYCGRCGVSLIETIDGVICPDGHLRINKYEFHKGSDGSFYYNGDNLNVFTDKSKADKTKSQYEKYKDTLEVYTDKNEIDKSAFKKGLKKIQYQITADDEKKLPPEVISSQIKKSMLSYRETFTGTKPMLKYYSLPLALIGYSGFTMLREPGSIKQDSSSSTTAIMLDLLYNKKPSDYSVLVDIGKFYVISRFLIGFGKLYNHQSEKIFWENERNLFIASTSNVDLSMGKRMELYNRQLSYIAADHYIDKNKPHLNSITRTIDSFIYSSFLTASLWKVMSLNSRNLSDISLLIPFMIAATFYYGGLEIEKRFQKIYYEMEKEKFIYRLEDEHKSQFSFTFDEKVKKSNIYIKHILKSNQKHQQLYNASMGLVGMYIIYGLGNLFFKAALNATGGN